MIGQRRSERVKIKTSVKRPSTSNSVVCAKKIDVNFEYNPHEDYAIKAFRKKLRAI